MQGCRKELVDEVMKVEEGKVETEEGEGERGEEEVRDTERYVVDKVMMREVDKRRRRRERKADRTQPA